ncbi:hypothetical protein K458DRAFT_390478 [Lentithecium fluviatile CBS 122367]|uniref:Uncharacterized protein n=1 Tax=Lentithecium fluviatile CBS 122367 TaxID=1168545 RepID=A0A6G1IZ95_9PLEO|nr:hypothetical protein K458DRAFT_390478 [Lentithecium fluviatile CBS 122367]
MAGQDEMIYLSNCVNAADANDKFSEVAYFSHNTDTSPAATARAPTEPGKTAWWEGGTPVEVVFADGNKFSANIPKDVQVDGAFVGQGKNSGGLFSCWRHYRPNAYSHDDVVCDSIYLCDHNSPPEASLKVDFQLGTEFVEVSGEVDVASWFQTIWGRRQATSCLEQSEQLPNSDCSITYSCWSDPTQPWTLTNGMARTLVDIVAPASRKLEVRQVRECTDWNEVPPFKCLAHDTVTVTHSQILKSGYLDVWNVYPDGSGIRPSEASRLDWSISCPVVRADCILCHEVQAGLSFGAALGTLTLNPEVAGIFGVASAFTGAFCGATC